jgi:hypothetical protein
MMCGEPIRRLSMVPSLTDVAINPSLTSVAINQCQCR